MADGAPISDYFPRIVSDEEFEKAQPTKTGISGGRRDKWIRLLTGLLVDAEGRPMHVHAQAGGMFATYQTAAIRIRPGEKPLRPSVPPNTHFVTRSFAPSPGNIRTPRAFPDDENTCTPSAVPT